MRIGVITFLSALFLAHTAALPQADGVEDKQLLQNDHVTVTLLELAPRQRATLHSTDHDRLAVFVNGGRAQRTPQSHAEQIAPGEVRFIHPADTSALTNEGTEPLRVVVVDFADRQGKFQPSHRAPTRTCNAGSSKCVDEKYLFCTARVCVEDVTMPAGAVSTKHGHTTDHMLIAVSDYQLTDEVQGRGKVVRAHQSGEVEYIPAGITHQMTNTQASPSHFIAVLWR